MVIELLGTKVEESKSNKILNYIYIYIYKERERERERVTGFSVWVSTFYLLKYPHINS